MKEKIRDFFLLQMTPMTTVGKTMEGLTPVFGELERD